METTNSIRKSLLEEYTIDEPVKIAPNLTPTQLFYTIGLKVRESTKLGKLILFIKMSIIGDFGANETISAH